MFNVSQFYNYTNANPMQALMQGITSQANNGANNNGALETWISNNVKPEELQQAMTMFSQFNPTLAKSYGSSANPASLAGLIRGVMKGQSDAQIVGTLSSQLANPNYSKTLISAAQSASQKDTDAAAGALKNLFGL